MFKEEVRGKFLVMVQFFSLWDWLLVVSFEEDDRKKQIDF